MSRQLIALVSFLLLQTVFAATATNRNWGAITIKNNGAYVAKFTIDYFQNGQQKQESSGSVPGLLTFFK